MEKKGLRKKKYCTADRSKNIATSQDIQFWSNWIKFYGVKAADGLVDSPKFQLQLSLASVYI